MRCFVFYELGNCFVFSVNTSVGHRFGRSGKQQILHKTRRNVDIKIQLVLVLLLYLIALTFFPGASNVLGFCH